MRRLKYPLRIALGMLIIGGYRVIRSRLRYNVQDIPSWWHLPDKLHCKLDEACPHRTTSELYVRSSRIAGLRSRQWRIGDRLRSLPSFPANFPAILKFPG
jgi:hypothetical protein